jgi:hypothetical protein
LLKITIEGQDQTKVTDQELEQFAVVFANQAPFAQSRLVISHCLTVPRSTNHKD